MPRDPLPRVLGPGVRRAGMSGVVLMLTWISGALCGLLAGLVIAAAVIA